MMDVGSTPRPLNLLSHREMLNPLNARLTTSIPATLRGIMECPSPQTPTLMRPFKQATRKVKSTLRLSLMIAGLTLGLTASTAEAITFANDPNLGAVSPGSYLDGTVQFGGCSGALLSDGMHVLTAAHCLDPNVKSVTFNTTSGAVAVGFSQVTRNPDSTGNVNDGADLAILTLNSLAPVSGYQIYRTQTLSGPTPIELAGYGATGTGLTGDALAGGVLRAGTNTYDGIYDRIPGNPYIFDFDDGTPEHDTLGNTLNPADRVPNLGTGNTEAMLADGDSGGPSFIQVGGQWQLIGIHSFRGTPGPPLDIDEKLDPNSTFGELSGDTRLAFYASWIDSVTGVPEPGSWVLLVAGLIGVGAVTRRSRRMREQPQ